MTEKKLFKKCSNKECVNGTGELPILFFGSDKARPDGLSYYCKDCAKIHAHKMYQTKKQNRLSPEERRAAREVEIQKVSKSRVTTNGRTEKICSNSDCYRKGQYQSIDNFGLDKTRGDGHNCYCRICMREYQRTRNQTLYQQQWQTDMEEMKELLLKKYPKGLLHAAIVDFYNTITTPTLDQWKKLLTLLED